MRWNSRDLIPRPLLPKEKGRKNHLITPSERGWGEADQRRAVGLSSPKEIHNYICAKNPLTIFSKNGQKVIRNNSPEPMLSIIISCIRVLLNFR
jgi:hypothetical protein